jgi:hypothetical protein
VLNNVEDRWRENDSLFFGFRLTIPRRGTWGANTTIRDRAFRKQRPTPRRRGILVYGKYDRDDYMKGKSMTCEGNVGDVKRIRIFRKLE